MSYDFYAYLSRMKHIKRWSLMRSQVEENVMEHSWQVAVIAHSLAIIKNEFFDGKVDAYKTMCLAVYHETGEVVTGDLPTPIKYYNAQINSAYKDIERLSCERLIGKLPEKLRDKYSEFIFDDEESEEHKLMKAADKISAYIKCVEEINAGNKEFKKAKASIGKEIAAIKDQAVCYFVENFLPSFEKSLDELSPLAD